MHAVDRAPDDFSRRTQLHALIESLSALIDVLARDPDPATPWRRHFIDGLLRAREIEGQSGPLSQALLDALAGSVMSVYAGMGSFNDYAPLVRTPDGRYGLPPGMEALPEVAGRVHKAALALRHAAHRPRQR